MCQTLKKLYFLELQVKQKLQNAVRTQNFASVLKRFEARQKFN